MEVFQSSTNANKIKKPGVIGSVDIKNSIESQAEQEEELVWDIRFFGETTSVVIPVSPLSHVWVVIGSTGTKRKECERSKHYLESGMEVLQSGKNENKTT